MLREKVTFLRNVIFWPIKNYLKYLKGFQAHFINGRYVWDIHIQYRLSKVDLAELVAFL